MKKLSRRNFLGASAATIGAGAVEARTRAGSAVDVEVGHLRTAQLVTPLGLPDAAPSLSWQIASTRRGVRQTACRIRVASSLQALKAGKADLWDSGRIDSAVSTGIPYGGKPLGSRQRAWWTVTLWDDLDNRVDAAMPTWWETGLLARDDWAGDWLAAESLFDKADRLAGMEWVTAPVAAEGTARWFRFPFETVATGETILNLASSGVLKHVTVDGRALDMPLHPPTSFGNAPAARLPLSLPIGTHVIAAQVDPPRGFIPAKSLSVAAQLRVRQADGTVSRLSKGWSTTVGEAGTPPPADSGWLAASALSPQPIAPWPPTAAAFLRRKFSVTKVPVRARLYVAALGACEMHLNGRRVGEDLLQSETSDFRKTILTRCYDVTAAVRTGANLLGAHVGDGWYASYAAPVGRYPFGPAPRRLLAQLEIEHADGTRTTVSTDGAWKTVSSPVLSSELYNGEHYDARLECAGWDTPAFDDRQWLPCWTAEAPPGRLVSQVSPPIRSRRVLKPVTTARPAPGVVIVDFGQNFAGLVRLKVTGAAGTMVTMRYAELLSDDGKVDQRNLRGAQSTDRYVLRGDPKGETYTPHFSYHGFRYVQLEGLPASRSTSGPESWSVEGIVIGSDLAETGLLHSANPTIQKLWLNTLWSQRSNFFAVPTDCPQRDERMGWSGDAQVFWDAAAFNMDVAAFTRRFLHDLRDGQTRSGGFPIYVPIVDPPLGGSPGWGDAGVMLPWICWRRYGDTAMVAEHWEAITRYLDGVIRDNPDLIWRKVMGPNFGDWLALDAKNPGDETTPKDLVATAMLKRSLDQAAEMGAAIGETEKANAYREQSEAVTRAFRTAFVKEDGSIGNGSQAGYIMAIRLGLLTPGQKEAAGKQLAVDIRRRGTLLSTGFLGTPLSLDALADIGETGLVYDLLLRTEFPSWGYMVRKGATTIWERWNGDTGDTAMNSFNHYALGAVVGFLYRRIAGIEEIEPGFAKVRIAPLIDSRVPSGGADYDSVRGRIGTRWIRKSDHVLELDVTIPGNTRAEVHLPLVNATRAFESGKPLGNHDGLTIIARDASTVVINVGSGTYSFSTAA